MERTPINIEIGANPALYSLKLMHYTKLQLDQYDAIVDDSDHDFDLELYGQTTPGKILETAYDCTNVDAKKEGILGSTTAMVLILRVCFSCLDFINNLFSYL